MIHLALNSYHFNCHISSFNCLHNGALSIIKSHQHLSHLTVLPMQILALSWLTTYTCENNIQVTSLTFFYTIHTLKLTDLINFRVLEYFTWRTEAYLGSYETSMMGLFWEISISIPPENVRKPKVTIFSKKLQGPKNATGENIVFW